MEELPHHTSDLSQQNIEKLAELFPNVVTETRDESGEIKRAIDFDLLRQELSDHLVEGPQERYQLDWPGKRQALFAANAPIAKTLRPVRGESIKFDTTKNLFIEGDNLDVLKLLQESYLGKVKLIYIDPPYNTGNDFVYSDDYGEDKAEYLRRSAQADEEGNRLRANTEANGRFHSDWLSMIYPRLKLARNLLTDDGVILMSIGDAEQASLRRLADEVFGESNFVAELVWEKGRKNDAKLFSMGHEYLLVYARSKALLRERGTTWREEKPGAREIWEEYMRLRKAHGKNDEAVEMDLTAWFKSLPKSHPSKKYARTRHVDKNGPWRDDNISWPGGDGPRYEVLHPVTGEPCRVPERGWIFSSPEEMKRQIDLGLVVFREDHTKPPFRKSHLRPVLEEVEGRADDEEELASQVRGTYFYKQSQVAVRHLRELMGAKVFNNPKDHVELSRLFEYVMGGREGIVMDFFAGSASTGEAVFEMNSRTGLSSPVILVQIPESLEGNLSSAKGAAKKTIQNAIAFLDDLGKPTTIAELAKIRLERAGNRILAAGTAKGTSPDVGYRTFRTDSTNFADVSVPPDALTVDGLLAQASNLKTDREAEDLLVEVLLQWGLELSMQFSTESVRGSDIWVIEDGALVACFNEEVDADVIREIAGRAPLRAVFRDSGFRSDEDRLNAEQIFKEVSPATDVKVI